MTEARPTSSSLSSFVSGLLSALAGLSTRTKIIAAGAVVLLVLVYGLSASGGRSITINGQQLNAEQIAYLDGIAGGTVPDGNYWLDPTTMAWGVVGDPQPRDIIGYGGGQSSAQGQHWSEVGQNYRGPFGDYMSDGKCSAVNGVMVGDC